MEESLPDPSVDNKDKDQLVNYRLHLRKLNFQPESSHFTKLFNSDNSLMRFLDLPSYSDEYRYRFLNQIWKDLTWALLCPNSLQELYFSLTEVDRYQDLVDQLSSLSSVVFVKEPQLEGSSMDDAERSRLFEGMVKFVQRHATLFPNKLRQARCTQTPDDGCSEEIHLQLATVLPPLPAPTFLDYTNWTQFVMRSEEVNLEHVKDIRDVGHPVYKELQFENRVFTNNGSFLQRCRSLKTVDASVGELEAQDLFRWAVKEQQERELDIAKGRTPKPLVPLQNVSLSIRSATQYQIVNDIARAFGSTLSCLSIHGGSFPSYSDSQALVVDASGWKCERLGNLTMMAFSGPLLLHPDLLLTCPSVKTLELDDQDAEEYSRGQPFRYLKSAVLEQVTTIQLMGTPAAAFHPDTLHTTKNLESLELRLQDTSILGRQSNFWNDDGNEEENDNEQPVWARHQAQDENRMALWPRVAKPVWTWDWDLPKLTSLSLSFHYAHKLQFKMFSGTPNLTHLRLTGASNIRSLGPLMQHWDYMSPLTVAVNMGMSEREEDDEDKGSESAPATTPTRSIHLPKLEDLAINGNWEIDTAMLRFICAQLAPNLESLLLHGPYGFSVTELIEITSCNLGRLKQVKTHLTISSQDARVAGVKLRDIEELYSTDYVLANPPQGNNPSFIFARAY